jgi:hypothetical protein
MEIPEIPFALQLTSDWTFFGLTPSYRVQKQEQIFDLVYHSIGGFTYNDVYNMPIYLRTFYIRKMSKMFSDQKKEHETAMRKQKARQKSSKPARGR